jgi:hypothetical protein
MVNGKNMRYFHSKEFNSIASLIMMMAIHKQNAKTKKAERRSTLQQHIHLKEILEMYIFFCETVKNNQKQHSKRILFHFISFSK